MIPCPPSCKWKREVGLNDRHLPLLHHRRTSLFTVQKRSRRARTQTWAVARLTPISRSQPANGKYHTLVESSAVCVCASNFHFKSNIPVDLHFCAWSATQASAVFLLLPHDQSPLQGLYITEIHLEGARYASIHKVCMCAPTINTGNCLHVAISVFHVLLTAGAAKQVALMCTLRHPHVSDFSILGKKCFTHSWWVTLELAS